MVVAVGFAGVATWVRAKPSVEDARPEATVPLVRVVVVRIGELPLTVAAQGTVIPRTETALSAQVAGEVVEVSPHFEVGGFFERGEMLVRLDRRDYELAVERAAARVAQAELGLVKQQAEARVAAGEWRQLGDGEPDPLVLREPQMEEARAALKAAEAELGMARLDLDRTEIRAPFDGRIRDKTGDVGQYLAPGQEITTVQAIDYAEVRLPVPDRQLAFLDLPLQYHDGATEAGPVAMLSADFAGRRLQWAGTVVRTEGELDQRSRMLRLVVRVEDPYGRRSGRPPLAVGLFVDAEITGRTVEGTVLPLAALHSGDRVLVAGDDDRLRWREVDVVKIEDEAVVVGGGLHEGERVCVSKLDVVVDGMEVRVVEVDAPAVPEVAAMPLPAVADDLVAEDLPAATTGDPDAEAAGRTTAQAPPAVPRPAAGRLLEVSFSRGELLGDLQDGGGAATVAARVSGEFSYSTSRLESPERFVVDLIGVVRVNPRAVVELAGGPVERIRIAQYQTEPEPVTRIVLDLQTGSPGPAVEQTDQGLTLTFSPRVMP